MKPTSRTVIATFSSLCCILTLLLTTPAQAVMPPDGLYEIETADAPFPYFIIENGSLKDASGFLYNPICKDGEIQAPPLITDMAAFFDGYPHTRIVDRGNGHFLLASSIDFNSFEVFRRISPGSLHAFYGELDFNSSTNGTFTLRVATAFFNGEGMGTSTCLAREEFAVYRVNS